MNILQQSGIVSTINFSPFFETEDYIDLRNSLFKEAIDACHTAPLKHTDVFDESILTFENINQALIFLVTIFRIAAKREHQSDLNISLRASLCTGHYFIHQDQIYGEAVNMATKLSYSSRTNELLLCRIDPQLIEGFINSQEDITSFVRSDDGEQCICIALKDKDITLAEHQKQALQIEYQGQSKIYQPSRNQVISIGRAVDSDILIDSNSISRHQATIKINYNRIFIQDHSSNGTYIYMSDRELFLTNDSVELVGNVEISCGISMNSGGETDDVISLQTLDLTQPQI